MPPTTSTTATLPLRLPLKDWLAWLDDNLEKPFLIAGLIGIILLITFQTLYRYVIVKMSAVNGALVWSEELARFIFIWISYLAIPLVIKNRSNIRVDILCDKLSSRMQEISWIFIDICCLALTGFMFVMGGKHIMMQIQFPQVTAALQVSYYIPYMILPIGFGLMSIRLIQDLYKTATRAGVVDTLIGMALCSVLSIPLFINHDISTSALLFGYFVLFLITGVPIAIGLGLAGLATTLSTGALPIPYLAQTAFTAIDSFPIMAITFFIAAGIFMGAGGLSERLLNLADEMLGSLHGGIALATVATCMFFGAISGSGPATVAAIGSLTIPAMVRRGYDMFFSCAIVAAAGAIGVMIPPSNPFVVYGVASQASIGKLFIGGIVPGLLTGGVLMGFSYFYSKKRGWKGEEKKRNFKTFAKAVWNAKWALMVPVIVLGGIYGGLMTPTEAAAVAAFYGLFVGIFVYKELNFSNLGKTMIDASCTSAIIILLIAMANIFGNIMTIEQIPNKIASAILSISDNKIAILLVINLMLLVVGTFMEALAAIVILTPILLPIVVKLGVDPIHFGIIIVVNLAIGFITPPVGVNLFVASGIADVKLQKLSTAIMPLLGLMIVVLLLVTYLPELSLFLTR